MVRKGNTLQIMDWVKKPSEHETKISAHFNGKVRYDGAPIFDKPFVALLFTNRCGSNLFAEYLVNTGYIGGMGEATNFPGVIRRSTKFGIDNYAGFVRHEAEAVLAKGRPFGMKVSVTQLAMLLRWNILGMFPGMVVYHVVRDDLLGQAISMSIAKQTGQWTSKQEAKPADPEFQFNTISQIVERTALNNASGRLLVESIGVPYRQFRYEEFTANPEPHIRDALGMIGIAPETLKLPEATLKKQANALNDSFRAKFLGHLVSQGTLRGQP